MTKTARQLLDSPDFRHMVARRWAVSLALTAALFAAYYGFILLVALDKALLARGFDPGNLYAAVAGRYGQAALEPGGLVTSPLDAVALGLALMLGVLGLPHILMRFYTVPDARAARTSVLYATGFIGYFYMIIPLVGFGAAALVGRDAIEAIDKGGNMAAPLLADTSAARPSSASSPRWPSPPFWRWWRA